MYSEFVFRIEGLSPTPENAQQWAIPLQGGTLGRSPECTWVLDDPNRVVSRQHAVVSIQGSQCHWKDLGTNCTQINGKPMPQGRAVLLNVGDTLKIGDYELVFSRAERNWDGLDELRPLAVQDPLDSLLPKTRPELNIDDLLTGIGAPQSADMSAGLPDLHDLPVLAQRMYVGRQQMPISQPEPDSSNTSAAAEQELARLRHLLGIGVRGCMQLLQARRIFKEEMGGDITTISGKANNPLKFSATPEEAMQRLLGEPSPAYLEADQALEQAFQDVLQHMQLSIARIQGLVEQVQTSLNPQTIEQEVNQNPGFTLGLSHTKKARLWDEYCARYKQWGDAWN